MHSSNPAPDIRLGHSMTEQTTLSLAAAAIGFVSAVFFCIGGAFNSVEKIMLQSTPYWDFSEPVARALAAQRAQYVTGGLLLLIAFFLQVLAAVASSTNLASLPQWLHIWPALVFAVLLPTAMLACFVCRVIEKTTIRKVLLRLQEQLAQQPKP